jgi:hypothetical protein
MQNDERNTFTFFISYYEAAKELPDNFRLAFYDALIGYALTSEQPELEGVPKALFSLIKPVIDKGKKRSLAGALGGKGNHEAEKNFPEANTKQTPSKPEANTKQTPSKPEANVKQTASDLDQEKEKEKEKENEKDFKTTTPSPPFRGAEADDPLPHPDRVPFREIQALYNDTCTRLPKITIIDGKRRRAVAARYKTYGGLEKFRELFEKANASNFLCGMGKRSWTADFDWLMSATNMAKVLEDKFVNRPETFGPQGPGPSPPQPAERPDAFLDFAKERYQDAIRHDDD